MSRRMPLAVPAIAAVALAFALAAGCERREDANVQHFEPPSPAPDVVLHGAPGESLSLARPRLRATLVTFGYTACPDVCPTTLSDWRRVRARLGDDGARVRFVFVSVDWRHDTPAAAAAFARRFGLAITGVAADSSQVAALMPAFHGRASYALGTAAGGGGLGHTAYSYVVDADGRIATLLPFAADPAAVARELRSQLRR